MKALEKENRDLVHWMEKKQGELDQIDKDLRDLIKWKRRQELQDGGISGHATHRIVHDEQTRGKDAKIQQLTKALEDLQQSYSAMDAEMVS